MADSGGVDGAVGGLRSLGDITTVVVHHSASEWGDSLAIDRWHRARGWEGIGYHYVVLNGYPAASDAHPLVLDGRVEGGRALDRIGAHVRGHNRYTVGVCLIGLHRFTGRQLAAWPRLYRRILREVGADRLDVLGHYELDPARKPDCPSIPAHVLRALAYRCTAY